MMSAFPFPGLSLVGSNHADGINHSPKVKARMRLQAAVSLLHLSTVPKFAAIVTNNLVSLAIMIQVCFSAVLFFPRSSYTKDPCYQVRDEFLRKYIALATHQRLPPHFNVIPFLTVHDPEADIRNIVRGCTLPFRQRLIIFRRKHTSLWHIVPHPQVVIFSNTSPSIAEHRSVSGAKMNYFEMIFVQFLHLLAHHPDFSLTQESLPDMAKCVYLLLS